MIESMATIHVNDDEVTADFAGVLEKIRHGVGIIVEQDHRAVAVIRSPTRSGRAIAECIASARASGSRVTLDAGFARDVDNGIKDRSKPWTPPSWD